MRYATTIMQKGGKSTLIYGPEIPVQKQRADFEEASAGKGETLYLWLQGSDRPRIKGENSKKFPKVPGKDGKIVPKTERVGSAS